MIMSLITQKNQIVLSLGFFSSTVIGRLLLGSCFIVFSGNACLGEVTIAIGHDRNGSEFSFDGVSAAAVDDVASTARVSIIAGDADVNAGDVAVLNNGKLPSSSDEPSENFFFGQGNDGGRIVVDFERVVSLKDISTFSWHRGSRGPQVYTLFAAKAKPDTFNAAPVKGIDPTSCGWALVASVDTRPEAKDLNNKDLLNEMGGQYGVTISANANELSNVQYLLFDIHQTETADSFGNTFYSEIDAIEIAAPAPKPIKSTKPKVSEFTAGNGKFRFTIDATLAPDLSDWAVETLTPVIKEWYPQIVDRLPSDGFQAPKLVALKFRNDMGGVPASAGGSNVNLNAPWFRTELQREARGAVVHELVHIVQQYDRASRTARNSVRTPGWIVEGIADYIRWYGYEPQSKGTDIRKEDIGSVQFDSSYRITANFLSWVTINHDNDIVKTLNAAAREGKYDENIWVKRTGKSVVELGALWKQSL